MNEYTHEAGVRQLAQQVAAMCRDVAVRVARASACASTPTASSSRRARRAQARRAKRRKQAGAGMATTLTWTPSGGELMLVESHAHAGQRRMHLTGQMGDVMKESAAAAFTYIRSRAQRFGLEDDFLNSIDVHVHLPKGGLPKDGPALGLPILLSLVSLLNGVAVRPTWR